MEDFSDRVVVLNFWAGWCTPCLAEMPILNRLHEEFIEQPVAILSVNVGSWRARTTDEEANRALQKIVDRFGIEFRMLRASSTIFRDYNVPPVPKTLVLGRGNRIRYKHLGTTGNLYRELHAEITHLLNEE